jgi:ferrous iron transport protein B
MNSEIKSKKWLLAGIGLQFAVGFTVSFLVFFFGTIFTGGSLGAIWMPIVGWATVLTIALVFTIKIISVNRQLKKEKSI